jgi:1,4-alpha-glucan branching enzyme
MLKKEYAKSGKSCKVTFILPPEAAPKARAVALVGDFNNWDKAATPLRKKPDSGWEVSLVLEAGREYHFRYYVDGSAWENDWNADKYVPSPYGDSENSVVIV